MQLLAIPNLSTRSKVQFRHENSADRRQFHDQKDLAEVLQLDGVGEMTEQFNETYVEEEVDQSDVKEGGCKDTTRGDAYLHRHDLIRNFLPTSVTWKAPPTNTGATRPLSTCRKP